MQKPTDKPTVLIVIRHKVLFGGELQQLSLNSNVVRTVSQLREMQWKSHYSVHMLEKMLAPGQIKRLLLNRNRLVRDFSVEMLHSGGFV